MTFKVLKYGTGPIYGHIKDVVVKTGLTWQEAHDFVHAQDSGTWHYWFTKE